MPHIVLNVIYTLKPGTQAAFLSALADADVLAQVRTEPGCLQYELFSAVETPDRLVLLERWDSPTHLDAHMAGTPFQSIHAIEEEYVERVDVRRFEVTAE